MITFDFHAMALNETVFQAFWKTSLRGYIYIYNYNSNKQTITTCFMSSQYVLAISTCPWQHMDASCLEKTCLTRETQEFKCSQ